MSSDRTRTFAFLCIGGSDTAHDYARYRVDLVAMYRMLRANGFLWYNITVLMSDGPNPAPDANAGTLAAPIPVNSSCDLDGDGVDEPVLAATLANVRATFKKYEALTQHDQLFVYFGDHGSVLAKKAGMLAAAGRLAASVLGLPTRKEIRPQGDEVNGIPLPDGYVVDDFTTILWGTDRLTLTELKALVSRLKCPAMFAMQQCFSGAWTDIVKSCRAGGVIATSCARDAFSLSGAVGFDRWSKSLTDALAGDPDIPFKAAADYARDHNAGFDEAQYAESEPALGSQLHLWPAFRLRLKGGEWSYVSVPLAPDAPAAADVFGPNWGVWEWDAQAQAYRVPTIIRACVGYAVCPKDDTVRVIRGEVPAILPSLSKGWNLVGPMYDSATQVAGKAYWVVK